MKQAPEALYQRLLYKYSHIGCPAAHYEDNCDRPAKCAENGRCLDLGPLVDAWIEGEFAGHGTAVRRETDDAIPGEPFISIADAKELTRRAIVEFKDHD